MVRVSEQLGRAGQPLTDAEKQRLVRKGKYCEALQGKSQKEQVDWLKTEFRKVLLDDGFEEAEYDGRLEVLMELLRSRGSEPSSSAQKLFS
eukprot:9144488-Alexandrium_andersonii.AAC.1